MMVNLSWEKVAYVLAVEIEKCDHQEGPKFIRTFSSAIGITQAFEDIHGGAEVSKTATCINLGGGGLSRWHSDSRRSVDGHKVLC